MFSSLRSKFTSRGSILEDTSPFEPAQSSAFEPTQPASSEPAKPLSAEDERRANAIRGKCNRFRILIIGRANAGKTTILQKVCNTTKKPVIYNSNGKKVRTSILMPSAKRGLHDITNEMVFKSNPGFIFHDSRGFEAGGDTELENVKAFITERSKNLRLQDQVHAIWYCIPMDDSRPFTKAEINFFSECGTGSVPVIAVFTKFDALERKAYQDLLDADCPQQEAKTKALQHAIANFGQHLEDLYKRPYPPKSHLYLKDMYKADANCYELTEKTATAIDNDTLKHLFVSTQQNNLMLCIKYAVTNVLMDAIIAAAAEPSDVLSLSVQQEICEWFPNFWLNWENWLQNLWETWETNETNLNWEQWNLNNWENWEQTWETQLDSNIIGSRNIQSSFSSFIGTPPPMQQAARLGVALIIILEHAFHLWDQHPSNGCVAAAIVQYTTSPNCHAVMQAIDTTFSTSGVDIFKDVDSIHLSRETFGERLVQIALDNRLLKGGLV